MIFTAIKLVLALATIEALGWLVGYWLDSFPLWERIAIYFGLGLGSMSVILMALSMLGVSLNSSSTYLVTSLIWIISILRLKRTQFTIPRKALQKQSLNMYEAAIKIILIIFIIAAGLNIGYRALARPLSSWDDRAIWGSKAKIIYYEKTIKAEGFTDQFRLHPHKDYPLLVPLSEYYIFSMLKHVNDRLIKVIFPGLFFSLVIIVYFHIKNLLGTVAGLAAALILISIPIFGSIDIGAASGYADVPLAFYYGAGSIYIVAWLRRNKSEYLYLSFIFLAMAALTKNEGLPMALIAIGLTLLLTRYTLENLLILLRGLVIIMAVVGFWFGVKKSYQVSWENYGSRFHLANILAGRDRLKETIILMKDESLNPLHWGRIYTLALISIILAPLSLFKRENLFIFLNIIFILSLYALIYLITPWSYKFLISVSFLRLLMPLAPMFILLIFYQLSSILPKAKSVI